MYFTVAFDERSLQTLSMKNAHTFHSLPLYSVVVRICGCSLSRLSRIVCKINLSVVYANERVLRNVCLTILAKNQLIDFLK